jgi:hypothetical protein
MNFGERVNDVKFAGIWHITEMDLWDEEYITWEGDVKVASVSAVVGFG